MIETWRKCLDENKIVGATLTDLSKAFNCLPHDSLVAKLEANGLDRTSILQHNHERHIFFLLGSDLHNFPDDNTVTVAFALNLRKSKLQFLDNVKQ